MYLLTLHKPPQNQFYLLVNCRCVTNGGCRDPSPALKINMEVFTFKSATKKIICPFLQISESEEKVASVDSKTKAVPSTEGKIWNIKEKCPP